MNIAPFSPLEIQLVRASLSTKTTDEIAILLERSAEDVTALINEITDGKAEDREADVKLYILEKEKDKIKRSSRPRKNIVSAVEKQRKKENESIATNRKNKAINAEKAWQVGRAEYRKREDQRKFKTRVVDPSTLITVKLDDKTWAQIEVQPTKELTEKLIQQTRATFEANKTLNKYKIAQN